MDKTCFKCQQTRPLDDFYRHPTMGDGHLGKCKLCARADVAQNYRANRAHYTEYERTESRRRAHYARHPGWKLRNPGKARAHQAVQGALASGRLRKCPCSACGASRVEAHHPDYTKPLEVVWLCRKHHLALHGKEAY
jgi:hypothetical protein